MTQQLSDQDALIEETLKGIATRPICEPGPREYVDICHYSRTGYAVHDFNGACSCRPANPPSAADGELTAEKPK